MKLFGFNIPIQFGYKNATATTPEMSKLLEFIQRPQQQIYRSPQEIQDFKTATTAAESNYNPNRYLLYKLYNDMVLDAHLTSVMQQRKNLTMVKEFKVVNKAGEENEKLSELLQTKWFRDFVNFALDSRFWGYSLVQFDDLVNDSFKCVELVPRLYVKPELHLVVKAWSDLNGVDYLEPPFSDWCIGVGNPKDLGLLHKASPLVIWKKNAMGAWSDYQNKFGIPPVIAKSSANDKPTQDKIDSMLQNFQRGAWGRFGKDDLIELIEVSKTDAYKVFDALIERVNQEISKLIIGQTGTTAEKAYVGSAEVHERVMLNYAEEDEHFIEDVCNYQLIPMMERLGVKFNGHKIEVSESDELTLDQQIKADDMLLKYFDLDPTEIENTYGRKVVKKEVQEPDTNFGKVQNRLNEYYGE